MDPVFNRSNYTVLGDYTPGGKKEDLRRDGWIA
jgi:hypothetical protein